MTKHLLSAAGQCAWNLCILLPSPLVLSGRERSGRQEAGEGGRSEDRGTKHRLSFWQRTSPPAPLGTHCCQHDHGRLRELSRHRGTRHTDYGVRTYSGTYTYTMDSSHWMIIGNLKNKFWILNALWLSGQTREKMLQVEEIPLRALFKKVMRECK